MSEQRHGRRPSVMSSLPFRLFPELSSTDMVVIIVKGMNLPAPEGKTKTLHSSPFNIQIWRRFP